MGKPHITIALIGSGKTTLASQLTEASAARKLGVARSYQDIINAANRNKLTTEHFNAAPVWLEAPRQTYTLIDACGHQETIKSLISHAPLLGGLLWSTTSDVPSVQERELLDIAQKLGLRSIIIFLRVKPEDTEEDLDSAEYLLRSALQRAQLDGNDALIVRGEDPIEESLQRLLDAIDERFLPAPTPDTTLILPLERLEFPREAPEGIVMGRLERGSLRVGDKVEVLSSLAIRPATVSSLSAYPNTATSLNVANAEDVVQCTLSGVTQAEVNVSPLIISPDRKTSRSMLTSRFSGLVFHKPISQQNTKPGEIVSHNARFVFLRRTFQNMNTTLWNTNHSNIKEKTRLVGYSDKFQTTYQVDWCYEAVKVDLVEAIPLEEKLLFWIFGYNSWVGFGVITSTERR